MSWDLRRLRHDVHALYGSDQLALLRPCLDSISDRAFSCRFHYQEAKRLVEPFLSKVEQPADAFALQLGADEEVTDRFNDARREAAAHITALLQSLHSMPDILSHAIYFALAMNLSPTTLIPAREVNAKSVAKKLPAGPAKAALSTLISGDGFSYLEAIVNRSKHCSVVNATYSASFEAPTSGEPWHGLMLPAFRHLDASYQERWAEKYLNEEYSRHQGLIQAIGAALNAELDHRCVASGKVPFQR